MIATTYQIIPWRQVGKGNLSSRCEAIEKNRRGVDANSDRSIAAGVNHEIENLFMRDAIPHAM